MSRGPAAKASGLILAAGSAYSDLIRSIVHGYALGEDLEGSRFLEMSDFLFGLMSPVPHAFTQELVIQSPMPIQVELLLRRFRVLDLERRRTGARDQANANGGQQCSEVGIFESPQVVSKRPTMKSSNLAGPKCRHRGDVCLEEGRQRSRAEALSWRDVAKLVCQLHEIDRLVLPKRLIPESKQLIII